ncbi:MULTISPECIES: hypothetical protein [Enorma]|uniref:hypothetical protein n=1 Tax=Enorma TaxID=1472762 RepID=UPI0012B77DFC|nr:MULTISPECIES: hypothetical protein [Enorma]
MLFDINVLIVAFVEGEQQSQNKLALYSIASSITLGARNPIYSGDASDGDIATQEKNDTDIGARRIRISISKEQEERLGSTNQRAVRLNQSKSG